MGKLNYKDAAIVIPCYNETTTLPLMVDDLCHHIESWRSKRLFKDWRITVVFVDDGSVDDTWDAICALIGEHRLTNLARVIAIKLCVNYGHQIALIAGYDEALKCDARYIASLDCDGQHSLSDLAKMFEIIEQEQWQVVQGTHHINDKNLDARNWWKKYLSISARLVIAFLNTNYKIGSADFRVITSKCYKRAQLTIWKYRTIRATFPLTTKSICYYQHTINTSTRTTSNYSFPKMKNLFFDIIASEPQRLDQFLHIGSISTATVFLVIAMYALITKSLQETADGWASLVIAISVLAICQTTLHGLTSRQVIKIMEVLQPSRPYETDEVKRSRPH